MKIRGSRLAPGHCAEWLTLFSSRTKASSSGVKSFLMLNVLRMSSGCEGRGVG